MLTKIKRNEKGFTLIELLIVIAVIAILAVAILSAINPVEQLNKANDARRRSDTAELLNTLERYYTTLQTYPWGATAPTAECGQIGGSPTACASLPLDALVAKGELKQEFQNRALEEYLITEDANQGVHVCFQPESLTWQDPTVAKFDSQGVAWTSGTRYVCVPE